MSSAWETTEDDVSQVLNSHGIHVPPERLTEIHGEIDCDAIEEGVLYFTDMDKQIASMLSDIEDQLMEADIVPKGLKLFDNPE